LRWRDIRPPRPKPTPPEAVVCVFIATLLRITSAYRVSQRTAERTRLTLRLVHDHARLRALIAHIGLRIGALHLHIRPSTCLLLDIDLRTGRLNLYLRLLLRLHDLYLRLRLVHLDLGLSHCHVHVRPRHANDDLRLRNIDRYRRLRLPNQDLRLRLAYRDLRLRLLHRDLRRRLINPHCWSGLLDDDPGRICAALRFGPLPVTTRCLRRLFRRERGTELLGHLEVLTQRRERLLGELLQLRMIPTLGELVEESDRFLMAGQLVLNITSIEVRS
jgi:hypothetical protein